MQILVPLLKFGPRNQELVMEMVYFIDWVRLCLGYTVGRGKEEAAKVCTGLAMTNLVS